MLETLFNIVIQPIYLILEFIFDYIYRTSGEIILSVFLISMAVSCICLPLYLRADELQEEEDKIQKKLKSKIQSIKKNFKGDERQFILATYYRQNNYHPIMGLRLSLSLLLQIPFFMAAYIFFCHLNILDGMQYGIIKDLSKPDELFNLNGVTINILPVLMTVVNIFAGFCYTKTLNLKKNKMLIIVSLVFLVLLYNSPSGLVLYWLFNNVFSLFKNICLNFMKRENFIKFTAALFLTGVFLFQKHFEQPYLLSIFLILLFIVLNLKQLKNIEFNFPEHKKTFLLSAFTLFFVMGVFIPSKIIASSPVEFIFDDAGPMQIILHNSAIYFGIFIFWGSFLYYFANSKLKKAFAFIAALLLFYSILNILFYKMPEAILLNDFTFSSSNIDFVNSSEPKYGIYTIILSLVCIFVFELIYKNKISILNKIISAILITGICLSGILFANINIKVSNHYKKTASKNVEIKKVIHLSKKNKNVMVIFLDRAISSYLPVIFKEYPKLYEQFKGFTYYPNTMSYAGYTMLGYLPILGGYEYIPINMDKRKGIFEKKFNEALTMLPAIFSNNNWNSSVINPEGDGWEKESWGGVTVEEAKILSENDLYSKYNIKTSSIPESISSKYDKLKVENTKNTKRNVVYYSILAICQAQLREYIYDSGNYHYPYIVNNSDSYSKNLIKNYTELEYLPKLTDFTSGKNSFLIFNNSLPHNPYLLKYPNYTLYDENDIRYKNPIEYDDDNFSLKHYHVNAAALRFVGQYLDFLRKNNVYNNTKIIIVSDHGMGYGLKSPNMEEFENKYFVPYNPLLLVKDFNQNRKFKTDKTLMTNADVPFIAASNLINNPKNPHTGKIISDKDKNNGIVIKDDLKWQPSYYLGKEKVLNKDDKFIFVKNNPKEISNWILNLSYKEALDITK